MKRLVVWLSVLAVLAAGGFYAWRYKQAHAPAPYTFQTEAVSRHHIVGKITATGTLLATVTVTVGTQVSGRIQKILVDFNSPVKKGQLIAKIDPLLFQAALEQSRANFLQAQAQLASNRAQAELTQKLYARELALQKDNLAAQQDVDTAQTNAAVAVANVAVAQASVAQAQASLHQAETNLDYTNIVSPIDGTVILRNVDVGQTVAASLSTPTLFTIAQDLRKMQVNTNVSEGDVGRLVEGMDATFTVDAFPGRRFKGKISRDPELGHDDAERRHLRRRHRRGQRRPQAPPRDDGEQHGRVRGEERRARRSEPRAPLSPAPELADPIPNGGHGHRHEHESGAGASAGAGAGTGEGAGAGASGAWSADTDAGAARRREWRERHASGAAGEGSEEREAREGRIVWIQKDGRLAPVRVRTGLTDGTVTELVDDALPEGSLVVTDVTSNIKASAFPLGGGGGGGGGGQRRGPQF